MRTLLLLTLLTAGMLGCGEPTETPTPTATPILTLMEMATTVAQRFKQDLGDDNHLAAVTRLSTREQMVLCKIARGELEPTLGLADLADTERMQYGVQGYCQLAYDPTPTPTVTPTPEPPPPGTTPTATPTALESALGLAEQFKQEIAASTSMDGLEDSLIERTGQHGMVVLCQVAAGEFEPDLSLADLTDEDVRLSGIESYCLYLESLKLPS